MDPTTQMKKRKKFYGTQRVIERRTTDEVTRITTRHLACGHAVREPNGGEAKNARFALCTECTDAKKVGIAT